MGTLRHTVMFYMALNINVLCDPKFMPCVSLAVAALQAQHDTSQQVGLKVTFKDLRVADKQFHLIVQV